MILKKLSKNLTFLKSKYIPESILFFIGIVFHLWSLMRYPAPFVDEAWLASRAWSFITTGKAFGTLDAGVFDRFPGHETFFAWLPVRIQSLGLRLLPKPELIGMRITSLIFGLGLVFIIYAIGMRFGGRKLGLLSAFLLLLSTVPFLHSSHLGRGDIITATFGFAALTLFLYQKPPRRFWLSFLSGILALLAFEIHAHGAIYFPVIVILFFIEMGVPTLKSQGFWGLLSGTFLGGLIYLYLRVIRFPETYITINQLAFFETHIPPILTFDPRIIFNGFLDLRFLFIHFFMLMPVVTIGLVYLLINVIKKRKYDDVLLFILILMPVVFYALLIRNKFEHYSILVAPILTIGAARFLLKTWKTWQGDIVDYINRISWGLTIVSTIFIIILSSFNFYPYFLSAQDRISSVVQDSDVVMGPQTYWFGLHANQYYSWETIIYYQRLLPGSSFQDVMDEYQPDIFILDRYLFQFFTDEIDKNSYYFHLHVPLQDVISFFETQAQLVDAFENSIYGPIEIYRFNWDQDSGL